MDMATPVKNSRLSTAMERTGQWIFSQEIPTDVEVVVGAANFPLHKFMLVAKSNYIRKLIMDTKEADLGRIDLSEIPGGAAIFEKAAKFCYGVNFEITVQNVAALRCAAEFLQMTDQYCDNNLAGRTEDFLNQVALTSLSGAIVVLKSCQHLLPLAQDLNLVARCVDVAASKACVETNFPSRSPPNWWTEELSVLNREFLGKVLTSMKSSGAKTLAIASALITYAERNLRDLVRSGGGDQYHFSSGYGVGITKQPSSPPGDDDSTTIVLQQRDLLESIVSLLPQDRAAFPINFLCCLLRSATYLKASTGCKGELEKRISAILEHVTVDDLLLLSFSYDGETLFDLDSVRKIISGFVDREKSMAVFNGGAASTATQRVGKVVDVYLGEIATFDHLSISKFNGIANLIPKAARKVDDDLYRAIDIYLKAHPHLDEIEREKVCSGMDPLKLSYEARVHASQNKRLPVQIVLHALYYDQLKLRSGVDDSDRKSGAQDAIATRDQLQADVSLMKENEALRTELLKMKMYISDLQKPNQGQGASSSSSSLVLVPAKVPSRKPTFLSSVSKTLGKLNPFRQGSKDTSNIDDGNNVTKPRRRRFSLS